MRILLAKKQAEQAVLRTLQTSPEVSELRICLSAAATREALLAGPDDVDLVVINQDLPDISGLEFCRQLLTLQLTTPLVLLIPEGSESLFNAAMRFGINAFLLKPAGAEQFPLLPSALQEIVSHHRDRPAREEAIKGLQKSHKHLKRIVEASTVPSYVIDDEQRITDWNRPLEILTGLSAAEMLGTKDAWKACYAAPRPTMADLIVDGSMDSELAKHSGDESRRSPMGEAYEVEDFFPGLQGGGGWLFITALPLRSSSGRILGAITTLQNVTESRRAVEQLERTASWLTLILNGSTVPTFVIDKNHRVTHWNKACELLTGVSAEQVIGSNDQWRAFYQQARPVMADLIIDRVLEDEIAKHYTSGHRRSLLGHGYEGEGFFPQLGDRGRWLFFTAAPLRSAAGEIVGAIETLQDITDRREAENALAESQRWLSQIIQGSAVPTFVIDREHRISEWNLACENLTGLKAEKMLGTRDQWRAFYREAKPVLADFITKSASEAETAQQYGDKYRRSLLGEGFEAEDFFPDLGEEGKWLFFTASPLRDSTGTIVGAIETLQDVTRRRNAEEALRNSEQHYRELSMTDELTGLYNTRFFYLWGAEEISRAERYQRPLSLLILDMDDFKSYNDCYGHPEGDLVLQRLAVIFQRCVRTTDWVCRYGGEEFTALLPETPLPKALEIAERIRREFATETFTPTATAAIRKTVSIGVAQLVSGEKIRSLLTRADKYLYRAKHNGKNRIAAGEETEH